MTLALVYHGGPLTPNAAAEAVLAGRATCISYRRRDQTDLLEGLCPFRMYENGKFGEWQEALRKGLDWDEQDHDLRPIFDWFDQRIWEPGCWAVIPDRPGAPSQLNDALLNEWAFGRAKGAPLWHMNTPVERLGRLCDGYDRVCVGWVGDPANPKEKAVDCEAYHRMMEDVVAPFLGNRWPVLHMMRGIAVVGRYKEFDSTDATTAAQNGHRHDWLDRQECLFTGQPHGKWAGRRLYADRLEAMAA